MLQTVSLCDEIVFEPRDDGEISLECDDPSIPVDGSNLIVKAARALSTNLGAGIKLFKNTKHARAASGQQRGARPRVEQS